MRDFVTPTIAILVGIATGIYTFQPLVLEQLKKDHNLNPKYQAEEDEAEAVLHPERIVAKSDQSQSTVSEKVK